MLPTTLGKATSNDIFTNYLNFFYINTLNRSKGNLGKFSMQQSLQHQSRKVLYWHIIGIVGGLIVAWYIYKLRYVKFIILIIIFLILIGIISCAACRGDFLLIAPGHWSMLTQWPLQSAISGMVMIMMVTRLSWMVSDEGVRHTASKSWESSTWGPYFSYLDCDLTWGTNFSFLVPAVSCSFSHCSFSVSKTLGINQWTFLVLNLI